MPTKKKPASRTARSGMKRTAKKAAPVKRVVKKKSVGARVTRPSKPGKRTSRRAAPAVVYLRPPETTGGLGACIRCRTGLPFDGEYPLCRGCFDEWVKRPDPYHVEKWCHSCREPEPVTYAAPVCNRCMKMQGMTL